MAHCKDCLYFERCCSIGVELNMKQDKEAENNCRKFKDATDIVKVVRCCDCRYFSRFSCKDKFGYDGHCHGTNHGVCIEDYCSFGKRKDV